MSTEPIEGDVGVGREMQDPGQNADASDSHRDILSPRISSEGIGTACHLSWTVI